MTREEAIKLLEHISIAYTPTDAYGDYDDPQPYEEALDMAIEALSQVRCNDCKWNDDVIEVVRCKDCRYWKNFNNAQGICHERPNIITTEQYNDFCSHGERREE